MADNKYTQAISQAKADLEAIHNKMVKINESVNSINTSILKQLSKGLGNTPQNAQAGIQSVTEGTKKLNAELKKQQAITRELERYKKNLNVAYQRGRLERAEAVKQAKLEAQATSSLVGAYQNLIAKQKIAKKVLQDELAKRNQNNKAIKVAQARYNALTKQVQRATVATKQLSTVNMSSLVRGASNLLAAFGIVGGAFLIADLAKNIFNLTKKLQSLDYALKTVMPDAVDFGQTQQFLTRIANQYGASIVALTERYTKFYAAAKQSKFALKDTEQIFESVTKAAGVLGLKKDELNGVFLALEQMISKGKVTTEELRRQLGERLPGAFGIMADAMGVTVQQLDDMLKKGEILSSEALPKFAVALEKAYGIENVHRVDTLVAAQERLNNAWVEFVGILSGEGGGGFAIGTLNMLADIMESIGDRFEKFTYLFDGNISAQDRFIIGINRITQIGGLYKGVMRETSDEIIAQRKYFDQLIERYKVGEGVLGSLRKEYESLYGSMRPFREEPVLPDGDWGLPEYRRTLADVENDLAHWQTVLKNSTVEEKAFAQARIKALKEEAKQWETNLDDKKKQIKAMEGSLTYLEELKSSLLEERDALILGSLEWQRKQDAIEDTEEKIKKLIKAQEFLINQEEIMRQSKVTFGGERRQDGSVHGGDFSMEGTANGSFGDENDINGFWEKRRAEEKLSAEEAVAVKALEIKRKEAIEKGYFDYAAKLNEEILENSTSLSEAAFEDKKYWIEKELEIMEDAHNKKLELENTVKDGIMEIGDAILDNRIERVEDAIQANRNYYAEELNNAELSEEQRSALEAERDAKEEQLEKKKRKREKENFLIKKGMALADIAINLAQSLAAINLANLQMAAQGGIYGATAGALYKAVQTPIAIQTAAVQAGMVIGTTLPQFEKGTDNAPEGLAIIDEKRPEVHMDKHGNIKSFGSTGGAHLTYTEKGDKIIPSHDKFFEMMGYDEMQQAIFKMNMQSNGEQLSKSRVDNIMNTEMRGMRGDLNKLGKEMKKLASRPIHNNVNVTVEDKTPY